MYYGRQHEDRKMLFNETAIGSQRYPHQCVRVVAWRNHVSSCGSKFEQDGQYTYMVILRHIHITIVAVEKHGLIIPYCEYDSVVLGIRHVNCMAFCYPWLVWLYHILVSKMAQ